MKINKTTLEELDKGNKMLPLTFDPVFKGVFSRNLEVLKGFLVDVLHLEYELEELDIRILNNELPSENVKEYSKRVDVNIVLRNDIYVEIEVNREDFNLVKYRNKLYEDKLYSMILEKGENPRELENIWFYQLNLNTENKNEKLGERIIVPYDISSNKVYMDNRRTILKYLEFYYKLYYNEPNERTRDVIWLASLSSKTFSELYEILSNILDGDVLKKFMKDVINMSWDGFNLHEWEKDKLDDMVAYNKEQKALKEGMAKGVEKTVIEMLKNDFEKEMISKITKLSIEEIDDIEKNN